RRANQNRVANGDATLASDHHRLADEGAPAYLYICVRQRAEVEHVQLSVVHDERLVADVDAAGAGMQVGAAVKVDAMAEANVLGKGDSHTVLDGCEPVDAHDQLVG